MSRGKKLDLFIGANITDEWAEVENRSEQKNVHEIQEPDKHFLVFKKEKRRGKSVTLVGEFYRPKEEVEKLLKQFKKQLGCGGAIKNTQMEFQGEVKERLRPLLKKEGFRFKQGH
ncbi:translation initiation factor [Sulfurimonas sediminis]|uniref:Translation initiation factor n=1 Tax=Sulfurimonas sediminis TaxID=2590020 RepID=A0A7M1B0A3_9BACT|nr:translation initiation factor [Sulfurimonas sediminis]QOP43075.1 translation initiation factor [Sulfurimonas sediminis]